MPSRRWAWSRRWLPLRPGLPHERGCVRPSIGRVRTEGCRMSPDEIDIPEVKAEGEAAAAAYEQALVRNDVAALDRFFLDRPTTIRYGASENLYGYAEIAAFRAGRSPAGLARTLERIVITTFGRDFAIASTLFRRGTTPSK